MKKKSWRFNFHPEWKGNVEIKDFSYTILIFAIVISFFGAYFAKKLVDKIPQDKFRYVIGFGLLFASIALFLGI